MSRGRGRGRGRGKPFEGIGLPPGEPAPPPILQPPPLYPALDRRPLELRSSEVEDYLVTIKQDLKQHALKSPYHLTKSDPKSMVIARYSDKYRKNGESRGEMGWDIDWNYFPKELKVGMRTRRPVKSKVRPKVPGSKRENVEKSAASRDVSDPGDEGPPKAKKRRVTFDDESHDSSLLVKKLDSLEKAETSAESEQSAEEENVEEVEVDDEYEDEEGDDYNLTYFDNGEDYDVGGDDEALEEAVY